MAASVKAKTDYNKLPHTLKLSPKWHELESTRRTASLGFACIGGVSLAKAGLSSTSVYNRLPSFFLLIGIAIASFEVVRRCMTPSLNDPVVALRLRQQAGRDIQTSRDMTFFKFFQKYKGLLEKKILEDSDVQPLLERDIEELDYTAFMTKHTGGDVSCKKGLIKTLSPEACQRLRTSCRVAFALNPSQSKDAEDLALAKQDSNLAAMTCKSWDEFAKAYHVNSVTEPQAVEALKMLFLEKAHKGDTNHRASLNHFREDIQNSLKSELGIFELKLLGEGKIHFSKMTWNEDWNDIKANLQQMDASIVEKLKEKLREGYIQTRSREKLLSEECRDMRETLELTPVLIDAAQVSIRDECIRLPYLGDEGFRAKYGHAHLNNGSLKQEHLEKIKGELRQEVLRISSSELEQVMGDLQILDLLPEILKSRWEKKSYSVIAKDQTEFNLFLQYAGGIFTPEVLKLKIIEALKGLTIFEILRDHSNLFPKFLQPSDRFLENKTFIQYTAEQLENKVFENEVGRNGFSSILLIDKIPLLIEKGFLSFSSPIFRQMLKQFITQHGQMILEFKEGDYSDSYGPSHWPKLLVLFKQTIPSLEALYRNSWQAIQKLKQEKVAALGELEKKQYKSEVRDKLNAEMHNESAQVRSHEDLIRTMEYEYSLNHLIRTKQYEISQHQEKIDVLKTGFYGLPLWKQRLQKQIEDLEKQTAPDITPLAELTNQVSEARKKVREHEQSYNQQREKDPHFIDLKKIRTATFMKMQDASEVPTRKKVRELEAKVEKTNEEISWKQQSLNPSYDLSLFEGKPKTEAEKKKINEEIAVLRKQLEELNLEVSAAKEADKPFFAEYLRLEALYQQQKRDVENYINQAPQKLALESAQKDLKKLQEAQLQMLTRIEVWNARPQELEKLRGKLPLVDSDIEKFREKITELEKTLPALQTELADLEKQEKQQAAKKKELQRALPELRASIEQKQRELNNDPEYAKFNEGKKTEKQRLEDAYKELVKFHVEELRKLLIPEL